MMFHRYHLVILLIYSIVQCSLSQNFTNDEEATVSNKVIRPIVTERVVTVTDDPAEVSPTTSSPDGDGEEISPSISSAKSESVKPTLGDETAVGDYLITTSSQWVSNTRETVCVSHLEGPTQINITVTNTGGIRNQLSISHSQTFPDGGSGCFEMQVPAISISYSRPISATLTAHIRTATALDEKQMKILVYGEQLETYIQTDKPKYKPGQEVKFRMLSIMSPSMKVVKENIPSVWIEAPNGLRIMQWADVKADEGLIDLQMKLSDEPMLGRWTINASVRGNTVSQTFVVEEYVLPKFEVVTDTPSAIYIRDESFKIKICGLYTYGQPVRGSVNATICFKYSSRDCNSETIAIKHTEDTGVDGCGEFELTSQELKWDISSYRHGGRLLSVDANFTEAGTDITLNGSSLSTSIKNTAVRLEVVGLNYYKPGFEYNGKVVVTNADGSSAHGINLTIAIRENDVSKDIQVFNLLSDRGVATFSFNAPTDTSMTSLYIKVTAEGYETDSTYDDFYGFYRIANNPYNSKRLTAFYSPSGSFLSVKPVPSELHFGGVHSFDVDYTVPTGESGNIDLKYIVIARGAIAKSGSLEVSTPSCSRQEKRYVFPIPQREELVVGLYPLPPTCRFSFSLPMEITPEMSPKAKLVIHYVRDDGEVVSDSIDLRVVRGLTNQVTLDFEDDETRPGETTTLTVQSDANSLCAVGIVDKSVELLGTTNQITHDKVFDSLSRYSSGRYDHPVNECTRSRFDAVRPPKPPTRPTRKGYTLRTSTVTKTKHANSVTVFQNAGVAFATNLVVETSPCYEATSYYWQRKYYHYYRGPARGRPVPFLRSSYFSAPFDSLNRPRLAFASLIMEQDNELVAEESENEAVAQEEVGLPQPIMIRTYFPETLLWEIKRTHEEDGTANFDLNVPDTITDWKANGFCISPNSDIGISETATLRAFKPFFASITLPYSVIRNETVPVKITVFNYLAEKCLMVKIVLQSSNNFTTPGNDFTRKVCVCGRSSKTVQFRIVPHKLGEVPVTVSARTKGFSAETSSKFCEGTPKAADKQYVGLLDGVQRDLLVEPEGIEKDVTESSIICLGNGEQDKSSYKVDLPDNTVPGSARVKFQVIGDIMGPALNNLDRLIRLPTGCGEQNIVKMAPNIYVLQYLINTGQADDELKQRIIKNIQTGYQRELNYRRSDGSYSAFGENDEDGSTWLTAFVLRSFAESDQFIEVNGDLMTQSIEWLIGQQNVTTGCVMSRGRVLQKAMKGGVSDEITLTAYSMITMLEVGRLEDEFISQAHKCLAYRWLDIGSGIRSDAYSVALIAYAFKLSDYFLYNEVLNRLNELAIEETGVKHWERPESLRPKNPCYYCRASSAEVEMTAYALLALDLKTGANQVEGLKISRWLVQQQNANGGYSSTQDTVIALKALSYSAEVLYVGETTQMNIIASASAGGEVNEFQIDSSNRLLLQRMDIEKAPTTVDIEASGSGCALVQIQALYNIYEKPAVEQEPFSISVNTSTPDEKLGCEKQTMRITVSYNGDDGASNMAIAEVKLVSGYYADKPTLHKLNKDAELKKLGFKRYEHSGNMVAFYFDEFTSKPVSFEFDVEQVVNVKKVKPGTITVYDYYEAELKSVKSYSLCKRHVIAGISFR